MAFRLEVQRRFPYDPRLGNRGWARIGGEETLVMHAILATGGTGRWIPGARVRHFIPEERCTPGYLRAYYLGRGRRLDLDEREAEGVRRSLRYWSLRAVAGAVAYGLGRVVNRPSLWVRGLRASSIARGFLQEYASRRRSNGQDGRLRDALQSESSSSPNDETLTASVLRNRSGHRPSTESR